MECQDIIINVIIGLLTGGVSGYIVTLYYREKDSKTSALNSLREDKQVMASYLQNVIFYLDEMQKSDFTAVELKEFRRFLSNSPRFMSMKLEEVPVEHHGKTSNIYSKLDEIKEYIEKGDITRSEIRKYRIDLLVAMLEMLKITMK